MFLKMALKVHRQISKKQCFEKYCSYDQVFQFSVLKGALRWSYLKNLTIDNTLINKQVRLFVNQTMSQEKIISTL